MSDLCYYNSGDNTLAVPCRVIDVETVAPLAGTIDGNAGPVLMNARKNWQIILANTIEKPSTKPHPQYKGSRR